MGVVRSGPQNPNWKGGRVLTGQGYVLIRVGVGHHLADVRGYAYEHRLVGEQMLGRRLLPGEEVHHKNDSVECRSINVPNNLEIKASHAEHMLAHRVRTDLRRPGQVNESVPCKCGCGASFKRFDATGRPRRFRPGHNPQASRNLERLLAALESDGPCTSALLRDAMGLTPHAAKVALSKWSRAGRIARVGRGLYALPGGRP